MDTSTIEYGMTTTVDLPYDRAVERTRDALGGEGFGVLTEIDVKATLKKKLDIDVAPYISSAPATRRSPTRRWPPVIAASSPA